MWKHVKSNRAKSVSLSIYNSPQFVLFTKWYHRHHRHDGWAMYQATEMSDMNILCAENLMGRDRLKDLQRTLLERVLHFVRKGTICYYVHCLVLWVMLRFNWMMYCCHRVSAQLRQYEIIIIIKNENGR